MLWQDTPSNSHSIYVHHCLYGNGCRSQADRVCNLVLTTFYCVPKNDVLMPLVWYYEWWLISQWIRPWLTCLTLTVSSAIKTLLLLCSLVIQYVATISCWGTDWPFQQCKNQNPPKSENTRHGIWIKSFLLHIPLCSLLLLSSEQTLLQLCGYCHQVLLQLLVLFAGEMIVQVYKSS